MMFIDLLMWLLSKYILPYSLSDCFQYSLFYYFRFLTAFLLCLQTLFCELESRYFVTTRQYILDLIKQLVLYYTKFLYMRFICMSRTRKRFCLRAATVLSTILIIYHLPSQVIFQYDSKFEELPHLNGKIKQIFYLPIVCVCQFLNYTIFSIDV